MQSGDSGHIKLGRELATNLATLELPPQTTTINIGRQPMLSLQSLLFLLLEYQGRVSVLVSACTYNNPTTSPGQSKRTRWKDAAQVPPLTILSIFCSSSNGNQFNYLMQIEANLNKN
eukprot:6419302-Amphidinium_carterae.1